MDYQIDFGLWGGIFAVPTAVADRHLKLCSEAQLKVLLLALRDAPNPVDVRYIGKRLGLEPDQVCDCLSYWQEAGLFRKEEQPPAAASPLQEGAAPAAPVRRQEIPAPQAATQQSAKTQSAPAATRETGVGAQKITTTHSRAKLTPSQINEMSRQDKNIPFLLQELQQRLGKPLSPAQTEAVIYTYSYLELTPDYILMAAEYCKSIGKPNIAYINQVIAGWVAQGVDTHDRAEAHIKALALRASNQQVIQSLFGIHDRSLTPKEKEYIDNWFHLLGYGPDLIKLAYDRTVDNTGKLAFGYLNTILTRWKEKGVASVQEALAEMGSGKAQAPTQAPSSYDLDEIQRLMVLRSGG